MRKGEREKERRGKEERMGEGGKNRKGRRGERKRSEEWGKRRKRVREGVMVNIGG